MCDFWCMFDAWCYVWCYPLILFHTASMYSIELNPTNSISGMNFSTARAATGREGGSSRRPNPIILLFADWARHFRFREVLLTFAAKSCQLTCSSFSIGVKTWRRCGDGCFCSLQTTMALLSKRRRKAYQPIYNEWIIKLLTHCFIFWRLFVFSPPVPSLHTFTKT